MISNGNNQIRCLCENVYVQSVCFSYQRQGNHTWSWKVVENTIHVPFGICLPGTELLSLHSGQSLARDLFRGDINDPCGMITDFCRVIANPCGIVAIPVALSRSLRRSAAADAATPIVARLPKHHKTLLNIVKHHETLVNHYDTS